MKTRKKLLSVLLSAAMVVSLAPSDWGAKKAAAEEPDSGQSTEAKLPESTQSGTFDPVPGEENGKDRFSWSLDPDGTLTISSTADMPQGQTQMLNYTDKDQSSEPWYNWHEGIKKIVFTGGMSKIGNFMFRNHTALKEVDITGASALNQLGTNVFQGCENLDTITGKDGIGTFKTAMGQYAFSNTGFTTVTLPNTDLSANYLFYNCKKLTEFHAPELLSITSSSAFSGCEKLKTLDMPKLETISGPQNFKDIAIEELKLDKLKTIQKGTGTSSLGANFGNCQQLTSVDLPELTVLSGDNRAGASPSGTFVGCTALKTVNLPKVEKIGRYAFDGCTSLESVTFPKLQTTDQGTFYGCTSLQMVKEPELTAMGTTGSEFYGCKNLVGIYAPKNTNAMGGTNDNNVTDASRLSWACGAGTSWSSWNSSAVMKKVRRLYLMSTKISDTITNETSLNGITKPTTIYILKDVESKFEKAHDLNSNITVKVVEDAEAMEAMITKERILTLSGPDTLEEEDDPEDKFSVSWKNAMTGEDAAGDIVTAAPGYVPEATETPVIIVPGETDISVKFDEGVDPSTDISSVTITRPSGASGGAVTVTKNDEAGTFDAKSLPDGKGYKITVNASSAGKYNSVSSSSASYYFDIVGGKLQDPADGMKWTKEGDKTIKLSLVKKLDHLTFKVQEDGAGTALEGVAISCSSFSGEAKAKVGEAGTYEVKDNPIGDNSSSGISVNIKKDGYEDVTAKLKIVDGILQEPGASDAWTKDEGGAIVVKMKKVAAAHSLKFKVVDDSDSPIEGAEITIRFASDTKGTTSGDGTYEFENGVVDAAANSLSYTFTVSKEGYSSATAQSVYMNGGKPYSAYSIMTDDTLGFGENTHYSWDKGDNLVKVKLHKAVQTQTIKVVDGTGAPLEGAKVTIYDRAGSEAQVVGAETATAAVTGEASISGTFPDAAYYLKVTKEGYNDIDLEKNIAYYQLTDGQVSSSGLGGTASAAESGKVTVTLYKYIDSLTVKVEAEDGDTMKAGEVTLTDATGFAKGSDDATYTASSVKDGTYTFAFAKESYETKSVVLTVEKGAVKTSDDYTVDDSGKTVTVPIGKALQKIRVALKDAVTGEAINVLDSTSNMNNATAYNSLYIGINSSTSTTNALSCSKVAGQSGVFDFNVAAKRQASYYMKVNLSGYAQYTNTQSDAIKINAGEKVAANESLYAFSVVPGTKADGVQNVDIKVYKTPENVKVKVHLSDKDAAKSYKADTLQLASQNGVAASVSAPESITDETDDVVYTVPVSATQRENANMSLTLEKKGYDKVTISSGLLLMQGKLKQCISAAPKYEVKEEGGETVLHVTMNKKIDPKTFKVKVQDTKGNPVTPSTLKIKDYDGSAYDIDLLGEGTSGDATNGYDVNAALSHNSFSLYYEAEGYHSCSNNSGISFTLTDDKIAPLSSSFSGPLYTVEDNGKTLVLKMAKIADGVKVKLVDGSGTPIKDASMTIKDNTTEFAKSAAGGTDGEYTFTKSLTVPSNYNGYCISFDADEGGSTYETVNTFMKDYNVRQVYFKVASYTGIVSPNNVSYPSAPSTGVTVDNSGDMPVITIPLAKKPTLKVKVAEKGTDGSTALEGCTVKIGTSRSSLTTDLTYQSDSQTYTGVVADNSYYISVAKEGYQTLSPTSSVIKVGFGAVSLTSNEYGKIDGDVVTLWLAKKVDVTLDVKDDKDSTGLTGVNIAVKKDSKDAADITFSAGGSDGQYTANQLEDGKYDLTLTKEGYREAAVSFTVAGGKITEPADAASGTVNAKMTKIGGVSITVQDANAQPITNAVVTLSADGGETHQAVHQGSGVYKAEPADGTYKLSVKCEGYISVSSDKDTDKVKAVTVNRGTATNGEQTIKLEIKPIVVTFKYYKDEAKTQPAVGDDPTAKPVQSGDYYIQADANDNIKQTYSQSNILKYRKLGKITDERYEMDIETGALTIKKNLDTEAYASAADVPWDEYRQYVKSIAFVDDGANTTKIPAYAFCSMELLTTAALPAGLAEIGAHAFENDAALEMEITSSLKVKLAEYALAGCAKVTGSLAFPDGTTEIPEHALYNTGISEVTIPDTVTTFGTECFRGTKIKSLSIPKGVQVLAEGFASSIDTLTDVTFAPDINLTEIQKSAFANDSSLKGIEFPTTLQKIGDTAFVQCGSLTKIDMSKCTALTELGSQVFGSCYQIKDFKFSDSTTLMGNYLISGLKLDELTLPNTQVDTSKKGVSDYGIMAGAYVDNLIFPEKFTTLPFRFFAGSNMKKVIIPKTVTQIDGGTFYACSQLEYVEFEKDDYTADTLKKERGNKIGTGEEDVEEAYPDMMFDNVGYNSKLICVADGATYDLLYSRQVLPTGGCIDWTKTGRETFESYETKLNGTVKGGWKGFLTKPSEVTKDFDSFREAKDSLIRANYDDAAWNKIQEAYAQAEAMMSEGATSYDKFASVQPAKEIILNTFKEVVTETSEKLAQTLREIDPDVDIDPDADYDLTLLEIDMIQDTLDAVINAEAAGQNLEDMIAADVEGKRAISLALADLMDVSDLIGEMSDIAAEAADLSEADYTADSWKALQDALAKFEEVKSSVYNHEVNPVYQEVLAAYDGLVKAGGQSTSAPGGQNTPAPGGQNTPAPGTQNTPAPGGQNTPAPGTQNTPAPGGQQTAAPGGSNGNGGGNVTKPTPKPQKVTVKKVSLKKVKSSKKKTITVQWKKLSGVTGYQIQVCTSKKFKKGVKKYTVKKAKTTKKTIKKLKRRKKYYVRVRAYKKVGKKTYTGKWSSTKKVKVK